MRRRFHFSRRSPTRPRGNHKCMLPFLLSYTRGHLRLHGQNSLRNFRCRRSARDDRSDFRACLGRDLPPNVLPHLEKMTRLLIVNGWPTGVEFLYRADHAGSFPATSDMRTTRLSILAPIRFLRPVSYQGFPKKLLPPVPVDSAAPRLIEGRRAALPRA